MYVTSLGRKMARMDVLLFLVSLMSMCGMSLQQNCCPNEQYRLHLTETAAICIREFTSGTAMNFGAALAECEEVDRGSLLKLDPLSELQDILPADNAVYLIGLSRTDVSSPFLWTADRTVPTEDNWFSNEPSDSFHCVQVRGNRQWETVNCGALPNNYICQAEVDCSVPECLEAVTQARCPCDIGFLEENGECMDVNECDAADVCNEAADQYIRCVNLPGSFECTCTSGTSMKMGETVCTLDPDCVDDNECSGENTMCLDSFDGRMRCQCSQGYSGSPCTDVDECSCDTEIAQCVDGRKCAGANEVCSNTVGSFTCDCSDGFRRQSNNFCVDIDECLQDCTGARQTCTNTAGSYECTCQAGYSLQGEVCVESCDMFCNADTEDCTQEAGESPVCTCKPGFFRRVGINTCIDVDECALSTNCAGENCVNTPGSFRCDCLSGFARNDIGVCVDINECSRDDTHNCGSDADCTNTVGSFTCACSGTEVSIDGECEALREFRVKIIAEEFNDTMTTYQSSLDGVYEHHFCTTILDILRRVYSSPTVIYDCVGLRFESGSVRGYLRVRIVSPTLRGTEIEQVLEGDVTTDISGKQRLYSDNREELSMTIIDITGHIDVQDISTYRPCITNPCQSSGLCAADEDVYDIRCVCLSGFTGDFCEIRADSPVITPSSTTPSNMTSTESSSSISTLAIVLIIVGALFILLLIIGLACCCCFCLLQGGGGFGGRGPAGPAYGNPAAYGQGVAPIGAPPSISGYPGRRGYYEGNSAI